MITAHSSHFLILLIRRLIQSLLIQFVYQTCERIRGGGVGGWGVGLTEEERKGGTPAELLLLVQVTFLWGDDDLDVESSPSDRERLLSAGIARRWKAPEAWKETRKRGEWKEEQEEHCFLWWGERRLEKATWICMTGVGLIREERREKPAEDSFN